MHPARTVALAALLGAARRRLLLVLFSKEGQVLDVVGCMGKGMHAMAVALLDPKQAQEQMLPGRTGRTWRWPQGDSIG